MTTTAPPVSSPPPSTSLRVPNYAPGIVPLTRATVTPTTLPPTGTPGRYVGSLTDWWGAPVLVDGECVCLACFPIRRDGVRVILSLPDGTHLRHARLSSLRIAP